MAGKRLPLCLLYFRNLNEWRAYQTEAQVRGHKAAGVVYMRKPTDKERSTVEAALGDYCSDHHRWQLSLPDVMAGNPSPPHGWKL